MTDHHDPRKNQKETEMQIELDLQQVEGVIRAAALEAVKDGIVGWEAKEAIRKAMAQSITASPVREQIAAAVDIIVQQTRYSDGSRKVTYITEVTGMEGEVITLQDIFLFKQDGYDENNKVMGKYQATGFMPKFYDDLRRKGIPVDMTIFREQ